MGISEREPLPAPITATEARAARLQEIEPFHLEVLCGCGRTVVPAIKLIMHRYGGQHRLGQIVDRITCKQCRQRPAEIYLTENGMRTFCYGGRPGWSVQIWPMNSF